MGKLSEELPIINVIKREMKRDENFTKDQVRDFERRVDRSTSVRFLVEMLQSWQNRYQKLAETCLPSTAQEEPLEVIELDDKVIYKLKDEA